MKRLCALLLTVVGFVGLAGSYFVGVDIVPHTFGTATYGIPYVIVGYDAGNAFANIGLSSPLTINGWYSVKAGGIYSITDQLKIAGYFCVWGKIENFAFADGAWAVGVGPEYKIDNSLAFFLNFNIPFQVDPSIPFWGFWLNLGFKFYFGGDLAKAPAGGK
jgi:hypothetical protein